MPLSPRQERLRRLIALAQTGLAYSRDPFDAERYTEIRHIATELIAEFTDGADAPEMEARFAAEAGYATPKLDCRGVVVDDAGRLLLVRERQDGLWTLPGGWVDVGQSPGEAVEKEVREEAGIAVRATRLLMLHDRDRHNAPPLPFAIWKVFVQCEPTGAHASLDGVETDAIGWFAGGDWPPLSETRTTAEQLDRCLALVADPAAPTAFDP